MKTLRTLIASSALASAMVAGSPAAAQGGGDQYMGQLMLVGFGYCPSGGWIEANGQSLSIAQYSALFSLFGTTYGGDGVQTFNVPDLRGRVVLHTGSPRPAATIRWARLAATAPLR